MAYPVRCGNLTVRESAASARTNARFAAGPQTVTLREGSSATTMPLSREVFADAMRHALYDSFFAAALPAAVHAASNGDNGPLAKLVALRSMGLKTSCITARTSR
jgi:hypothetical protein